MVSRTKKAPVTNMIRQISTISLGRHLGGRYSRDVDATLRERNETIAALEKARAVDERALDQLRCELDELRIAYKKETEWQRVDLEKTKREKEALEERMRTLECDMKDNSLLQDYADLITDSAPDVIDAKYVKRLQSQLCKALKKMEMMSAQTALVKKNCDDVVKSLKDELSDTIDEKCKTEVELMTRLAVLNNEKLMMEAQYEGRMQTRMREIKRLDQALKLHQLTDDATAETCESDEHTIEYDQEQKKKLESLQKQVDQLRREKKFLEEDHRRDMKAKDAKIAELEQDNYAKERTINKMKMDSFNSWRADDFSDELGSIMSSVALSTAKMEQEIQNCLEDKKDGSLVEKPESSTSKEKFEFDPEFPSDI